MSVWSIPKHDEWHTASASRRAVLIVPVGSITGAMVGGLILGMLPDLVLAPALAVILLVSAVKLARHD